MVFDLQARAAQLLDLADSAGVQSAEVYQMQTRSQVACFDANRLKQLENRESSGLALRVWKNDRPGLAVARGDIDLSTLLEKAIILSALNPVQEIAQPTTQLFSRDLDRGQVASRDRLLSWGEAAIADILQHSNQCFCSAELSSETERVYLVNSAGMECGYTDTTLRALLTAEWIRGHDFLCVEANQTQRDQLDLSPLTQRIHRNLQWASQQADAPVGQVPILFTPHATEVLWETVQAALNAQKVVEGVSPWRDFLQHSVVASKLTLSQHPNLGPYSCPFDDEGLPSQSIELLKNGQLQGFFSDQKYATLLGLTSTGNGFRPHLHSYPIPELINLYVEPGSQSFLDLVAQMEDGLIVDQVLGEPSPISGEISFNLDLGYRVQAGEIVGRVKDVLVTGNVYTALNQLMGLGNDNEWNEIYYSPSLLVSGFSIVA